MLDSIDQGFPPIKLYGDALQTLQSLTLDEPLYSSVTSPPYFNLLDYEHDGQIGLEEYLGDYLRYLTEVFTEVYRLTIAGGAMLVNIGNKWDNLSTIRTRANGFKVETHDPTIQRSKIQRVEKQSLDVPGCVLRCAKAVGWIHRDTFIWVKPNGRPSRSDRPANSYEEVLYLRKPTGKKRYMPAYWDGRHLPGNVLTYAPVSDLDHPCPMPERMAEDLILATVPIGGLVLDPFMGTGTVLNVAEKHQRHSIGIDIKPW